MYVCSTNAVSGSCLYLVESGACVWCRVVNAGRYVAEIKELFVMLNFWTGSVPQPRLPRQTLHLLSQLYVPHAMRQTDAILESRMLDITVWCWLSWNKAEEWRETSHTHTHTHQTALKTHSDLLMLVKNWGCRCRKTLVNLIYVQESLSFAIKRFSLDFANYSFDLCPSNSFSLFQLCRILENFLSASEMTSVISVSSLNFALSVMLFILAVNVW